MEPGLRGKVAASRIKPGYPGFDRLDSAVSTDDKL